MEHSLKRKCRHFDEILITGCTGSCHFDNFQCSQWWKFHQNEDIYVSVFTFVSSFWTGNVSDRQITKQLGFLQLVEEEDDIMADRGFTIRDLLLERKARLIIPPFTRACASRSKGRKLVPGDITKTRDIAILRIHVVKTYRILSGVLEPSLRQLLDNILVICAVFCNMRGPLIK